jgi:hypothetical protein
MVTSGVLAMALPGRTQIKLKRYARALASRRDSQNKLFTKGLIKNERYTFA